MVGPVPRPADTSPEGGGRGDIRVADLPADTSPEAHNETKRRQNFNSKLYLVCLKRSIDARAQQNQKKAKLYIKIESG